MHIRRRSQQERPKGRKTNMSEKIRKNRGAEVADAYAERIKVFLRGAYSEGYGNGAEDEREAVKNLRGTHKREAGEYDDVYAKNWRDSTPFYGWCAGCKRPHSGRWAHIWEYCPWCGGKIDRTDEPYPRGRRETEDEESEEAEE